LLVDALNDNLYTVNSSLGAAALVGPLGFSFNSIAGLAFDPNSRTLYHSGLTSVGLYRVDLGTGKGTKIGNLAQNMPSLAYDPDGHMLYGISGSTDSLAFDPCQLRRWNAEIHVRQLMPRITMFRIILALGQLW
jgi:hypothetical protein